MKKLVMMLLIGAAVALGACTQTEAGTSPSPTEIWTCGGMHTFTPEGSMICEPLPQGTGSELH